MTQSSDSSLSDKAEADLRRQIAADLLGEAQFEGVRARRVIQMCAAKVLDGLQSDAMDAFRAQGRAS